MSATQKLLGGRYQFIKLLGTNQAGQTALVADIHYPGHPKCVIRQLRLPTRNPMTLKFILSLLKKKVEVLEVIGQHKQIPSTFAAFDAEQSFYIVQEFIPGRSLQADLVAGQPWSKADVLNLLREILPVMAFAQEHGVLHGNLKPSKIIRHQNNNCLVLLDLGSIKSISQNVSSKDSALPSPALKKSQVYLAPEQFQGQASFASDHYALGMIAIQALTGFPAEELPTAKHPKLHQELVTLLEGIPDLNLNVAGLLARMVHPSPARRYAKAAEILADLDRIQTTEVSHLDTSDTPGWLPE
jgi:serine/threonine protein kinase